MLSRSKAMAQKLYTNQTEGYKHIVTYMTIRQKGLCHLCQKQIETLSPIVKREGKPPTYYHPECAMRIHLL
jgi:hypothetical protein